MSETHPQPEMLLDVVGLSDAQLLTLFVRQRDELAFAELVQRHRRLVWSVCRRVLSETHDIEDVFQATFLVLVRDASRIRKQQSLANWLYGVAYRLSLRVARQTSQRREVELLETHDHPERSLPTGDFANFAELFVRQTVDDELHALPNRYRQPLVLHYLAGKSQKDVASELSLTVGAVDGLLKRGRHELRMRLARRGVSLGAVWLVLQWTSQAAQAAPLAALTASTVHAGLALAAGKTAGVVSAAVLELTRKELLTMSFATKPMLVVTTAVCVLGIVVGGTSWLFGSNPTTHSGEPTLNTLLTPNTDSQSAAANLSTASRRSDSDVTLASSENTSPGSGATNPADVPVGSPSEPQAGTAWDFKLRSPAIQQIEKALTAPTEIAFTETPLTDFAAFLSDYHKIPILLDVEALSDEGVTPDTPITQSLSGVSFESALNIVLSPLHLDYVIANDVMTITTKSKADVTAEPRVYDLSRLQNLDAATLSNIIVETVNPDEWTDRGGLGMLVSGPGFLVISQNQRTHRLVTSLLDQLERQALVLRQHPKASTPERSVTR